MIIIDGSHGGGQLLRTALSLSALTKKPFKMTHIRGKRENPGLQRQHLTAVNAMATICNAPLKGNMIHSHELEFIPGTVHGGDYTFDIGTAVSTTLVFQTLLPALLFADKESTITIIGGTANPLAPPAFEIKEVFLWHLEKFGIHADFEVLNEGFYPAGGGKIRFHTTPITAFKEVHLTQRGKYIMTNLTARTSRSLAARNVADRLITGFQTVFPQDYGVAPSIEENLQTTSPGCYLSAITRCEHALLGVTILGEKTKKAEDIGKACAQQLLALLQSEAAVDPYTADQLLLYLALAGKGSLRISTITLHMETNIRVIEQFLPVHFTIENTTITVHTL